jgi:hypothetical protein
MAIWGCGSPAHCCQSAVAGGVIYADLWGELSTHLAPQALFTQSSPVCEPLLQVFPFPSTLGEVTLHPLSQVGMFIYSSCQKCVFPPLLWSFPPSVTLTSFPAAGCWVRAFTPILSSPVCLFITLWGIPLPPFSGQGAPPSLQHVFIVLIAYYSVSLFTLGGVDLSRGLCWSGPGLSVGVPRIAYLTLWSVSSQAVWALAPGGGLGALLVSLFKVKCRCYAQAGGVEGSKFCLFLVVFPVRWISSVSPRFYFRRHAFCFLPLATILESSPRTYWI